MYERKQPLISIVIPSWFTKDQHGKYGEHETFWFATHCLKQLIQNTKYDYELIIVNNGSTLNQDDVEESDIKIFDELKDKLDRNEINEEEFNEQIKILRPAMSTWEYWSHADVLIRNKKNLGFGPSCNQGFAVARGRYVLCLNNDILVWEGWEEAMLDIFDNWQDYNLEKEPGVVMPALMKETRDAREALQTKKIDLSLNSSAIGKQAEFGSMWMAKKSTLEKIRNLNKGVIFDERFKLGMGEDRYLWHQMRQLGYETYKTHRTRVFHQGNMTICKVKNRRDFTEKNRELLQKLKEQ